MDTNKTNTYYFYTYSKLLGDEDKEDLLYVGSTIDVKTRTSKHRSDCNNKNSLCYNYPLYTTMREYGGYFNMPFKVIHTQDNLTSEEAHKIEEQYRISLNANLNTNRCYCSKEERKQYKTEHSKHHYLDNKTEMLVYCKNRYEDKKTEIQEYKKTYHIENKERLNAKTKKYYDDNKAEQLLKRKAYREANKEKIAEQKRLSYLKNKIKLL